MGPAKNLDRVAVGVDELDAGPVVATPFAALQLVSDPGDRTLEPQRGRVLLDRESGQEYGASTGRPRRCGWYDAVAVRYAARVNGLDALALTKLDVLDSMDELRVCIAYRHGERRLTEFPADAALLAECEPEYETLLGWRTPTARVRVFDDLPDDAKRYIARIEEVSGVPVSVVSTGSDRGDTIVRDGSFATSWLT